MTTDTVPDGRNEATDESAEMKLEKPWQYAVLTVIGIGILTYTTLAVLAPSTVAGLWLPTATIATADNLWETVGSYWLIAFGMSGILVFTVGTGGLIIHYTGSADATAEQV